jgi:hypothetical protein
MLNTEKFFPQKVLEGGVSHEQASKLTGITRMVEEARTMHTRLQETEKEVCHNDAAKVISE